MRADKCCNFDLVAGDWNGKGMGYSGFVILVRNFGDDDIYRTYFYIKYVLTK